MKYNQGRRFLLYILIACFFYMPNVFTQDHYFKVCSSGCDYTTLDQALTKAEEYSSNDKIIIDMYNVESNIISDHTLNSKVYISLQEGESLSIDGKESVIVSNTLFEINNDTEQADLELANLTIYANNSLDTYTLFEIYDFMNTNISNVIVKANACQDSWCGGITIDNYGATVANSLVVQGFTTGVYSNNFMTLQNSDLSNCLLSVSANNSIVKIENTKVSALEGNNTTYKINSSNNLKVIYEDLTEMYYNDSSEEWDEYLYKLSHLHEINDASENLRLYNLGGLTGVIKKSMNVKTSSFDLLDTFFGEDCYELSDLEIDNSHDEILTIENGIVKTLKNGKSVITLTDKKTDMEYRITVNVDLPKLINPKTKNSLLLVGFALFIMIESLGLFLLKKQR